MLLLVITLGVFAQKSKYGHDIFEYHCGERNMLQFISIILVQVLNIR